MWARNGQHKTEPTCAWRPCAGTACEHACHTTAAAVLRLSSHPRLVPCRALEGREPSSTRHAACRPGASVMMTTCKRRGGRQTTREERHRPAAEEGAGEPRTRVRLACTPMPATKVTYFLTAPMAPKRLVLLLRRTSFGEICCTATSFHVGTAAPPAPTQHQGGRGPLLPHPTCMARSTPLPRHDT